MTKLPDPALLEIAARFSHGPVQQTRENMAQVRAMAHAARRKLVGQYVDDVAVSIRGNVRCFKPLKNPDLSRIIVYIHGGGWINCDTVTHGAIMGDLAALTGYEVQGPDYPLAPEQPYPAGLNAICDLVRKLKDAVPDRQVVLAGDSAGANLALATAVRLRDENDGNVVAAMLLWYGCYRKTFDSDSHARFGTGEHGLSTDNMRQCWDWYLNDHPNPTYGDLKDINAKDLPPCYLGEAELDCLADDTKWLAKLLDHAGITHQHDLYPDVNHGFIHFGQYYPPSLNALKGGAGFLKSLVGN